MTISKKEIILSFLIFLVASNVYPQSTVGDLNYLSSREQIEFNLPQLGVSLKLPPRMGMRIPVSSGKEVSYEIDDQTYYSYNLEYLNDPKTNTFNFLDVRNEKYPLSLTISPYTESLNNFTQNYPKEDIGVYYSSQVKDKEPTPSIKSGLGKSASYKISSNNTTLYIYNYFADGYIFSFTINEKTSNEQRTIYESIIMSFKQKNLANEKRKYERRVESGYFRKNKTKKIELEGELNIQKHSGKTNQKTTFQTPHVGISIDIPANWTYEVDAKNITDLDSDKKEIELNDVDLFNEQMIFHHYRGKDISIIFRILSEPAFDIPTTLKSMTEQVEYSKWAETTIDGIPANIVFHGSKADGSIDFYLQTEKVVFWIGIYGYNLDNQKEIDTIIESIKIDAPNIKRDKRETQPTSSLFKLEEIVLEELDNIELKSPNLDNACEIDIKDLGLQFYLPDNSRNYKTIKNKQLVPIPSDGIFENLNLKENENYSLMYTDLHLQVNISTSRDNNAENDIVEETKSMKTAWKSYKHISNIIADVLECNNLTWSILIYQTNDKYFTLASTQIENHVLYFNLSNIDSLPQVYDRLNYLKTFKVEK